MKNNKKSPDSEKFFVNEDILSTIFSPDVADKDASTDEDLGAMLSLEDATYEEIFPNESVGKRILKYFIPWKGDAVKEIIRKCVFLVALVTFIIAGTYLALYYHTGVKTNNDLEEVRGDYYGALEELADERNDDGSFKRFDALYKKNKDVIGWVSIDGTKIDYPVFQTDNNDYYIDHDMNGDSNRYGAVFADSNAKITENGNSTNVVLYGHNMIDGSMFTQLLDYKNLSFYRENPIITFDTLYNEAKYKVFAVYIVNAEAKHDDGYVFNYRKIGFGTSEAFMNFIAETRARSIIDTNDAVSVEFGDELLTLSTCSYEFDNARTVVVARKLRENESPQVSVEKVKINKTPLYPQAYYDKHGGKKPKVDLTFGNSSSADIDETIEEQILDFFKGENEETYTSADIITDEELYELGEISDVVLQNYVGLSLEEALIKTSDLGIIVDLEFDGDDETDKNDITSQSLPEGEVVKKGSKITLKVKGVQASVEVADLVGMNIKKARKIAAESGLAVRTVILASAKKKDTVLMQSVSPGEIVTDHSIVLYVSWGMNKIPDVQGLGVKEATALLKQEGFETEVKYHETINEKQIGIVTSQLIDAGTLKKSGETVVIYAGKMSSGEALENNPYIEQEVPSNDSDFGETTSSKKNNSSSKDSSTSSNISSDDSDSSETSTSSKETSTSSASTSSESVSEESVPQESSSQESSSQESSSQESIPQESIPEDSLESETQPSVSSEDETISSEVALGGEEN